MIATSLGQTFENEGQFVAAQWDPKTYASSEDQTDTSTPPKVPAGSPDRLYVSPNIKLNPDIEDRRNQSQLDALIGYLKDQTENLGPKLQAMMAHPMSSDTAMFTSQEPVQKSQLGDQLGLSDIPEPHRTTMEKLLGINGPRYQTWPERLVRSAVTEPHDVMQGQSEDDMIRRANDLATFAVGGSMPAALALKAEQGTLGSFAGIRSLAASSEPEAASKMVDLGRAQVMESNGVHPDEVYHKTGFFRGADGKWRYELDDSKAGYYQDWINDEKYRMPNSNISSVPLGEVLDHPELFKAYPHLNLLELKYDPNYLKGAFQSPGKNSITLGKGFNNTGTLMHEIQHAIQEHEGFAAGGSTNYNLKFDSDVDKVKRFFKQNPPTDPEVATHVQKILDTYEKYKQAGKEKAAYNYLRLAGETEARNTDTRLLLSDKERRMILPRSTEDIPASMQHVSDKPIAATAYGYKR